MPPEGWTKGDYIRHPDIHHWSHTDGRKEQGVAPTESKPAGIIALANAIPDTRALSMLNLAENNLGELVIPEGWTEDYDEDEDEVVYRHTDGREQKDKPGKPEGIIAIANAIPDMGALTSLNLASNIFGVEGAKIIAAVLPGCK
jgi:hypothetical protein